MENCVGREKVEEMLASVAPEIMEVVGPLIVLLCVC